MLGGDSWTAGLALGSSCGVVATGSCPGACSVMNVLNCLLRCFFASGEVGLGQGQGLIAHSRDAGTKGRLRLHTVVELVQMAPIETRDGNLDGSVQLPAVIPVGCNRLGPIDGCGASIFSPVLSGKSDLHPTIRVGRVIKVAVVFHLARVKLCPCFPVLGSTGHIICIGQGGNANKKLHCPPFVLRRCKSDHGSTSTNSKEVKICYQFAKLFCNLLCLR